MMSNNKGQSIAARWGAFGVLIILVVTFLAIGVVVNIKTFEIVKLLGATIAGFLLCVALQEYQYFESKKMEQNENKNDTLFWSSSIIFLSLLTLFFFGTILLIYILIWSSNQ